MLYQSLNQPEEALKYYLKTVALEPNFPAAIANIAVLYAASGKYSEAIKYYQRSIELEPNNPEAYYSLALAYFMSDQLIKFKANLIKAQELYQEQGNTAGLEKVAGYMVKIKEIEDKFKQVKR